MKVIPLIETRKRPSSRRIIIPPKNTLNTIANVVVLLRCFVETGSVVESQLRKRTVPQSFGFPSKLEFENVLS
uniref:Uncharacterized protein n=1 Tax=Arundo donax TaxID=35708 RepID=A0A0A8ZN65_ARUDO